MIVDLTALWNKIDAMQTYVNTQIQAIPPSQDPLGTKKQQSQIFYDNAFNQLRTGINSYLSDKMQKERYLTRIIFGIYQNIVISNLNITGLILQPINGTYLGYDDITNVYNCNEVFQQIMAADVSDAYDGPVDDSNIQPNPGDFFIIDLANAASEAEEKEITKRSALVHWLESTNINNAIALLFEEHTGASVSLTPSQMGVEIYIDRKAKDVIDFYSLNVYIPTYLR